VVVLLLSAVGAAWPMAAALGAPDGPGQASPHHAAEAPGGPSPAAGQPSHRLIVELASPPLADWARDRTDAGLHAQGGRLEPGSAPARAYLARLAAEQDAFVKALRQALPGARVATFLDENHALRPARYAVVMNAVAVERSVGDDPSDLARSIERLPGVRAVYRDHPREPQLYASVPLIGAPALYDHPAVGGVGQAGSGIKVAVLDGGIHHAGPMFDGEGYDYPLGYPLGHLANTNGKIIASRAYFRAWDPPSPGDEQPWPGVRGTSHGQHTASTAVGNAVEGLYDGVEVEVAGVAPRAYAMSYRVFYSSIQGIGSMYSVEGIAALEDIVRDGADVVNNSWGSGASSAGGEGDPLDMALLRAWRAGVFVAISAGNSGPNPHTVDHPSEDYVNVASTSTTGAFRTEGVNATAPEPVSPTLLALPMQTAAFGAEIARGSVFGPHPYLPAAAVSPANELGCEPFPEGSMTGKIALISRGACGFGVKVLNAQDAGAVAAIVHNNAAGGDLLVYMSGGDEGEQVTIPALFVGHTSGLRLTEWHALHADDAALEVSTMALQVGNIPDIVASSSSRGPGVGYVLKPDIAAPGVNILAEGYAEAEGEARHLGFGQASGTSMAAPHVAGAAAVLKQIHPDWSPEWIKAALMGTARFTDVYLDAARTRPAQPLDIGAGRMDLTRAADPGAILNPPSLSFGRVVTQTTASLEFSVTNVAGGNKTFELSSVDVSMGYSPSVPVAGLSFEPASLTVAPGATGTVTVRWDASASARGYGDNQGYLLLESTDDLHRVHLPLWMRVTYPPAAADVLVMDVDGSSIPPEVLQRMYEDPPELPDYTPYYTEALDSFGLTYDVLDTGPNVGSALLIPEANWLQRYQVIVLHTGDLSAAVMSGTDQHRLREYANHGGPIVAFGQNLAAVFGSNDPVNASAFYRGYLGAEHLMESINQDRVFTDSAQLLVGLPFSPFAGKAFDVSARGDGAGNQISIDEIRRPAPRSGMWRAEDDVRPLLQYGGGGYPLEDGLVAMSNRSRPSLEVPRVSWSGRNVYFAFGLEGVNSDTGHTPREELLAGALTWALDEPTVAISHTVRPAHETTTFFADMEGGYGGPAVSLRWDFGDGTPFTPPYPVRPGASTAYPRAQAGHAYMRPGTYTVRVEAVNALGTPAIGQAVITVPEAVMQYLDRWMVLFLPSLSKAAP